MNAQKEGILWDTLDFQAKQMLSLRDYQTYLEYKEENDRDLLVGFIWDCLEEYDNNK